MLTLLCKIGVKGFLTVEGYIRRVNYHETDKMGVTHHSNYIKWMEEARVIFLEKIGFGYNELEKQGIMSPVISVECQYKHPTTFDDRVLVEVFIEEFKGVRLSVGYKMTNLATGVTVLTGRTMHCFIDKDGRPIRLSKRLPSFDKALKDNIKPREE